MAEPNAIASYDQPFDNDFQELEQLLMSDDDAFPVLGFAESLSTLQQNNFPVAPTRLQPTVAGPEIEHPSDPLFDVSVLEDSFHTGTPWASFGTSNGDNISHGKNDSENLIQLSSWPSQVAPNTCSSCHILREIVHTNGVDFAKLEIHGKIGSISHAVIEKYGNPTTNQDHEFKMFDFSKETMSRVKQFLEAYFKEQTTSGYIMLPDPLSSFYEAVCVGLNWEGSMDTNNLIDPGVQQTNQRDVEPRSAKDNINKTPLFMKRKWAETLKMKDLVGYFNTPIEVVAKKIQLCPTVIKKICRKHGLSRWPYRKIRSIEKKISKEEKCLASVVDAKRRIDTQAKIDKLRQEITNIYAAFNV